MTTFTVNLLPKFLIIWEFSIISIVLSQWSEVTFTWVIIFLYQPHYQILWHKTPFFFFFHCDLVAHSSQLSNFWHCGARMNTKASLCAEACWRFVAFYLNLVDAFSSCHNFSHCVWPGKRKLECMLWLAETLEYSEPLLMVYIVFPTVTNSFSSFFFLHPFSRR